MDGRSESSASTGRGDSLYSRHSDRGMRGGNNMSSISEPVLKNATASDGHSTITVAINSFQPGLTQIPALPYAIVCMHLGPSVEVTCSRGGRLRHGRTAGAMSDLVGQKRRDDSRRGPLLAVRHGGPRASHAIGAPATPGARSSAAKRSRGRRERFATANWWCRSTRISR